MSFTVDLNTHARSFTGSTSAVAPDTLMSGTCARCTRRDEGQADVAAVAVADDHVDLVLLDEPLGREHGLRRLAAGVVEEELDAAGR